MCRDRAGHQHGRIERDLVHSSRPSSSKRKLDELADAVLSGGSDIDLDRSRDGELEQQKSVALDEMRLRSIGRKYEPSIVFADPKARTRREVQSVPKALGITKRPA